MKTPRPLIFLAGIATAVAGTGIAQIIPVTSFPDVAGDAYYAPAIEKWVRSGVVRGYDNGRFGPNDAVTRGQVLVMLERFDTRMVNPLREQIDIMRVELGLGYCGDGTTQTGEQCDDGNLTNGDGCSDLCQLEIARGCPGGHRPGDTFMAADGCNTCTCSSTGLVSCTEKFCLDSEPDVLTEAEVCISADDCAKGEICYSEDDDCQTFCEPGQECEVLCAGVCIPAIIEAACGNGICESNETAYYTTSEVINWCPEDCAPTRRAVCGNGICETGEDEDALFTTPCPQDCSAEHSQCVVKEQEFEQVVDIYRGCIRDSDCAVFEQSCPYVTCGEAVNGESLSRLKRAAEDIIEYCEREGIEAECESCAPVHAECMNSRCVLKSGY